MTIVNILSRAPIDNIIGALIKKPERLVFVGYKTEKKFERKHRRKLENYFSSVGRKIKIEYVKMIKNDFEDILDKLAAIVDSDDEVVFDINGGEDMILTAIGCLNGRFDHVHLLKANPETLKVREVVVGNDDSSSEKYALSLTNSVENHIICHGGCILYDGDTNNKELIASMKNDIDLIWKISIGEYDGLAVPPTVWNKICSVMAYINSMLGTSDERMSFSAVCRHLGYDLSNNKKIMEVFRSKGLIDYTTDSNRNITSLSFKNRIVEKCLCTSGQILETKVFMLCGQIESVTDRMTGVIIDWDGVLHSDGITIDTRNEIDVIAMRNLIPCFISCKNGKFTEEELYKLNTVTKLFGVKYGMAMIITVKAHAGDGVLQRAEDMGIPVLEFMTSENGHKRIKSDSEMCREIAEIINSRKMA